MVDYANQISNLITRYLPYTASNIGDVITPVDYEISTGKVVFTLSEEDFDYLNSIITNSDNPDSNFVVTDFYIKNTITSFSAYPSDAIAPYGFEVIFSKPHQHKTGDVVSLKGFANTSYNIDYKVISVDDRYNKAFLYPLSTVDIEEVTADLGFIANQYKTGLNGTQQLEIENESLFQLSYTFDEFLYLVVDDNDQIDSDFSPKINYLNEYVKVMNAKTFLENLTDPSNAEYLIIDTSSLQGNPVRSESNKSETDYSTYSRSGFYERQYTLSILYLIERNADDSNNQTTSGSDIVDKQVKMYESLTSILRQQLVPTNDSVASSMTLARDSADQVVSQGRVVISYQINFSINYKNKILLDVDLDEVYKIEQIKINDDQINLA